MIAQAQVIFTLRPCLGPYLTETLAPQMAEICGRLNAYSLKQEIGRLADDLDRLLFNAVRVATRGSLLVLLDDESWVRVRLEDFTTMAD